MEDLVKPAAVSRKTYQSSAEVKWCPGCGGYGILAALQQTMADLGLAREKNVFVSGIGCSSRLPYYMSAYGFHTIHGRAAAIATGVKLANPELTVWVITGDGDSLAIGGNHFIHLMRRNLDINVVMFNNRIYGLTKGQVSPTSPPGSVSKTTPMGSAEAAVNPVSLALSAGATFVSRALATDMKGMVELFKAAVRHRGVSFVEVLQNCVVFNDGAFNDLTERALRPENILELREGEALIFGADRTKAIALDGLRPKVVDSASDKPLRYLQGDKLMALMAAEFSLPDFPVPLGIFYREERTPLEALIHKQIDDAKAQRGTMDIQGFISSGDVWRVD